MGYSRRDNGVADTQAEGGELLPEPVGATASQRASSAGGDPAGVCGGCIDEASDDLVKALGCEGISKSQVSRICQELDGVVEDFLGRPLDGGSYPYLWLDALTQKVREAGRIVNVSVVVATAVNSEGKREIVGMDVGTSEDGAFWLAFLRSLVARASAGWELGIGRSSGTQGCHRNCLRWGQLAAVPHPLHDQPAHSGP